MTGTLFTLTFAVAAPYWTLMAAHLAVRAGWARPAVAVAPEPQRLG